MYKLLVNTPEGIQEVLEVSTGGSYYDASKVLWDESIDGTLPSITLGGMERVGGILQFNQTIMDATNAVLLANAQAAKNVDLALSHLAADKTDIGFTTAGAVTKNYQVSEQVMNDLDRTLNGCSDTGVVPVDFYWVSSDNTKVPFTYADVQGLYRAIFDRGWTNFKNLQTKKQSVRDAVDVAAVESITW